MNCVRTKTVGFKTSLFIFMIICISGIASNAAGALQEPNAATAVAQPLSQLDIKLQKKVSIDVSDVPIETVIRQLVEQVDIDFIKSPKVTGNVTVTLKNVTVEEALQGILDVNGFAYIKGEKVIRILAREEIPAITERLVTETFEIIYADVTQVVTALEKFKSPQGSVSSIQGTSHIIVTDTENKIRDIGKLLEKIDRITPQVLVEVRIYDITSKDNLDLGIDWYASRRTNFSSSNLPVNDDITISKGGADTYTKSLTDPSLSASFIGGTSSTSSATDGYLQFGILNKNADIYAQLRAEKENVDAKLLANPRIMVLDNETALFDIVTEHPYIERTISGSTITETVKFKNVGVKLSVIPHVTRDNMVRMHILPEFGVVSGQAQVSSTDIPIVDTRKVDTTALVENKQAVVLGGMRKKDTTKQVNKIPLLGDIPILGYLFRFEGESTNNTELVVFITPTIITQPAMSDKEQEAFDVTNFAGPEPKSTRAEKARVGKTQ
jgi:type IV pilus assembly protein PilQ